MSAVAAKGDQFPNWLKTKLRQLNTDETVYGSYIIGILESDETEEEKLEALEGILSAVIETDLECTINEIIAKWEESHPAAAIEPVVKPVEDLDKKLAQLLESQVITTTVQRIYTPEELRIREQILAQYAQQELEEEEDDGASVVATEKKVASGNDGGDDLVKNTNVSDVQNLQREKREQARVESKEKKDKDKADREKQKAAREEKKEKRKTVKGERRR